MPIPSNTTRAPLYMPNYVLNVAETALVKITDYPGRVVLMGKQDTTYRILAEIPCTDIDDTSWPNLFVDVPDYVAMQSVSWLVSLVPDTVTDTSLLTMVGNLAP